MSTAAEAFEEPGDPGAGPVHHSARAAEQVRDTVAALLGHGELRPGQAEAAATVLAGRDTLAVKPSASGKCAVYRVVAALPPGHHSSSSTTSVRSAGPRSRG